MNSKLLAQIHKVEGAWLAMINKRGTIIAPKGCEKVIMKTAGRGVKTQHFVAGCTAAVSCRFLSPYISNIFPKWSDLQL